MEEEAEKARADGEWLLAAMPEASVNPGACYTVKCDMVVKRTVIDPAVDGRRSSAKRWTQNLQSTTGAEVFTRSPARQSTRRTLLLCPPAIGSTCTWLRLDASTVEQ